jgi:CubicO group peptidase (beta-lactamase class C family)
MAISVISRHGKVAYTKATGYSDAEGKVPIKDDDIFRLYSMTKPPVAVGLLMLYEEGRYQLDDPVWYFLGSKWKKENMRVFEAWTDRKACEYTTVPADREITMRHVLTHTAGLSHGFDGTGVGIEIDRIYAKEWKRPSLKPRKGSTLVEEGDLSMLAAFIDGLGDMPLLYQPGTQWNYSHAPDVQGRLIEVLSGQSLDVFLQERLFEPCGMVDTGFDITPEKAHRFTHCYSYMYVPPQGAEGGGGGGGGIQLSDKEATLSEAVSGDDAITFPHVGSYRDNDDGSGKIIM